MLLHMRRRTMAGGIPIPIGLITPFNGLGSTIPVGWEQFILGGANAFKGGAAGSTGGQLNAATVSSFHPGHIYNSGTGIPVRCFVSTGGSIFKMNASSNKRAHDHPLTFTWTPPKRAQVMMRATAKHSAFPPNTGILSDAAVAGADDVTPLVGSTLSSTTADASANVAQVISYISSTYSLFHVHADGTSVDTGSVQTSSVMNQTQGAHNHGNTAPAVTDNLRKIWLGMWASAADKIKAEPGMYALWESPIPPKGWVICDGTLDTPDLTDHFIGFNTSRLGEVSGNGTMTPAGSLAAAGAHGHAGAAWNGIAENIPHSQVVQGTHLHSISAAPLAYEPQFYTLVVIKIPQGA